MRRARASAAAIREHGPDAVAFYVSGQLLTEDYYVANKLMKGFIGSANIDTNSRLCMASAVAGHKRAFGEDLVPGCYEDLELADLIVLVGSNTAWCHPILFRRIEREKAAPPGSQARRHRPAPHTDGGDRRPAPADPRRHRRDAVQRPADCLQQHGAADAVLRREHTPLAQRSALEAAELAAGDATAVAAVCGADARRHRGVLSTVRAPPSASSPLFSQGVNQSSAGTDKVNSIINCHLLTGRIGRPGMGPFSLTGQPNAMGGREVGGLANMLAAHMDLEAPSIATPCRRSGAVRGIASRPGLKAVDLFEAIHAGRIKAVWIMATNPVVSLPDADRVRAALQRCELVVVSDCVARYRHRRARARAAAGRRLGREGRHGDQFRAAHLAPAPLPASARGGAPRLVDHLRGRPAHGLRR